jgi:hypothetical protein
MMSGLARALLVATQACQKSFVKFRNGRYSYRLDVSAATLTSQGSCFYPMIFVQDPVPTCR